MSDIIYKISTEYPKLTQAEKKVANYITENSSSLIFDTLDNLAFKIGVSTTSILRLARALGYSGYSDMQQSIREYVNMAASGSKGSLIKRLQDSDKNSDRMKLFLNCLNKNVEQVKNTFEAQNEAELDRAVHAIAEANNVFIIGLSDSFALAYNMSIRLGQVRKNVRLMQTVAGIFPMELQDAGSSDVCVAFLFPRYSKATANVLTLMKKNKVKVILFTGQNTTPVKNYGDIIFPCSISGNIVKDSIIGPMCLSNYIVDAIIVSHYDETMEILANTEEILSYGNYLDI